MKKKKLNKKSRLSINMKRRMKYLKTLDMLHFKAEYTNSNGSLLNAIPSEPLLKRMICLALNITN